MIFPLPDLCCLPRDLPQSLRMPCRLFFTVDQLRHLQQPGETDWPTSTILGKKLSRISEVKPSFLVFALSPGCTWAALLLWLSYTPSWPGSLTYWLIWWETQWLPKQGGHSWDCLNLHDPSRDHQIPHTPDTGQLRHVLQILCVFMTVTENQRESRNAQL